MEVMPDEMEFKYNTYYLHKTLHYGMRIIEFVDCDKYFVYPLNPEYRCYDCPEWDDEKAHFSKYHEICNMKNEDCEDITGGIATIDSYIKDYHTFKPGEKIIHIGKYIDINECREFINELPIEVFQL